MGRIRAALINPPDILGLGYPEEDSTPPLGLAYIAATLRQNGFQVDLFDLARKWPVSSEFLAPHGFFDYELYGFTAYSTSFSAALDVLALLRQRNRGAVVVFGGPHASPSAEALLREYAEIDCVITHEGELPMLELARNLLDGKPELVEIPNLVWREGGFSSRARGVDVAALSSSIIHNTGYFWVQKLDALPEPVRDYKIEPDRRSLRYERRDRPVREIHISSSRGCPKRCTFCSIIVSSPNYRVRSVESLMDEIKRLHAQSPFGHIDFVDANFFVATKRTLAFALALYNWNPDITWSGTATADMVVRHSNVLEEIGRLNCVRLEIGIESGSASQLLRYNKRTSIADNIQAVQLLRRARISIGLDFIMFDPETTLAELRENLTFLFEAELWGTSPPACLFNEMRLYPGTPARERYIQMFGLSDYHLDSLEPPFLHDEVAALYKLSLDYYSTYQVSLKDAIVLLQELVREGEEESSSSPLRTATERQNIAGLIIELQHEPYRFFDEMLTAFEQGAIPLSASLEDLAHQRWHKRFPRLMQRVRAVMKSKAGHKLVSVQTFFARVTASDFELMPKITLAVSPTLLAIEQNQSIYLIPLGAKPIRLNFPASFAWKRLAKGQPLENVCAAYARRFGLPAETARRDVDGFAHEMVSASYLISSRDASLKHVKAGRHARP